MACFCRSWWSDPLNPRRTDTRYQIKWDLMAVCIGLGGDVRGPNRGMKVEVDVVGMEWEKVEIEG